MDRREADPAVNFGGRGLCLKSSTEARETEAVKESDALDELETRQSLNPKP